MDNQDKEISKKFDEDLQNFLMDNLSEASERVCIYAGTSLIRLSLEVMYQNSPNKKDFEKTYKAVVDRIFTMWKELLEEEK